MSQNWIQWHYLQVKILLFFYHFLFELQASCPDSSNRTSSFILKIFLFNSSNNSRTSTKGLQLPLRGNYTHTHTSFSLQSLLGMIVPWVDLQYKINPCVWSRLYRTELASLYIYRTHDWTWHLNGNDKLLCQWHEGREK